MTRRDVIEGIDDGGTRAAVRGISTFQALRYRNFRLLWIGLLGHSFAMWAGTIAQSWLIWQLTGSGTALGLVSLFRAVPILFFSLPSGVAADRLDKRYLLIASEVAYGVLAFLLAILITTKQIEVWHVFVYSFLGGIAMVSMQPTRQALVPILVPAEDIMNGVALSNAAMNVTRVVGPAAAGVLIALVGIDGIFYMDALLYVGVVATTIFMQVPPADKDGQQNSIGQSLREGFSYVRHTPAVLALLVLALVPMTFGMPYNTLLPIYADSILQVGASGLGLLTSASGVSALVGSLAIASAGSSLRHRGWWLLLGSFLFGAFLVGFAQSTWLPLSFLFIGGVGLAQTVYMAINNACLLTFTPPALHGRVMAVYMLDRGLMPLGAVLAGAIADALGAPFAVALMGAICVVLVVGMGIAIPQVRRID